MAKIKDLPKHKRPREKLSEKGAENLSDAELLAIIFRTGRAGKSALDIARETLKKYPLSKPFAVTQEELTDIKGLENTKVITLKAALELGRRAVGSFNDSLPVLDSVRATVAQLADLRGKQKGLDSFLALLPRDGKQAETVRELTECLQAYKDNCRIFIKLAQEKGAWWKKQGRDSVKLADALKEIELLSEENHKLIKEAELMYRLINRLIDICLNEHNAKENGTWNAREITSLKKQTEEARDKAVSQLKLARYFHHQAEWLVERFPDEKLRDVEGLVKLVDKEELKENDWSLTPGRYVGVASEEEDPDFDFGEAMRTIHSELDDLNAQAADLAERISGNFRKLGI